MKAAVIGLGSMGWGAAVSLLRAGIDTTGCDISEEVAARFRDAGGGFAATPAEAAKDKDVILVFVVNAQQARSVLFGKTGAVAEAELGCVFVLCPTMSPAESEKISGDLVAAGMRVIDCPVSGGAAKAESGELTLIASGANEAFEAAAPALEAISSKVFRLGETPGTGAKLKMINQHLAGIHIAAMAEALVLASKEELDLEVVYDVITQSAGNSWMFENRAPQVLKGDYAPLSAVDIFVKDLGIVTEAATNNEKPVDVPLARVALELFTQTSQAGMGREADAAVAKILAGRSDVKLP
ncbi:L-threonate dehydrogenase [Oceanibium sediminis]|uniref:L-threonate dehydrogenase n=1 Tax=Oceanibium sediminis TaxID=2026339 RepID=UPI000DD41364|nr:L-threonate dehydrogenase [Oceanibium sediminis]